MTRSSSNADICDLSVVVPFLNEEGSLAELHRRISAVMGQLELSYELILVDDGSTDAGADVVERLFAEDPNLVFIRLRRNFGKAAALQAGVEESRGRLIITMDADLQDSPDEIPRFIAEIDRGYDVVSGWKRVRNDPPSKTVPSRFFNWVTRKVSGLELNDFNCGFKIYRREVFDEVDLYGELHRYIPVLAAWRGFRVGEIPVEHHRREHGHSKYGIERYFKGFFDLLTIVFTRKYERRPLHIFGFLGISAIFLGLVGLAWLILVWLMGMGPIGNRPLLFFSIFAVTFGAQLFFFGILAEMFSRMENRFQKGFSVATKLRHTHD